MIPTLIYSPKLLPGTYNNYKTMTVIELPLWFFQIYFEARYKLWQKHKTTGGKRKKINKEERLTKH